MLYDTHDHSARCPDQMMMAKPELDRPFLQFTRCKITEHENLSHGLCGVRRLASIQYEPRDKEGYHQCSDWGVNSHPPGTLSVRSTAAGSTVKVGLLPGAATPLGSGIATDGTGILSTSRVTLSAFLRSAPDVGVFAMLALAMLITTLAESMSIVVLPADGT